MLSRLEVVQGTPLYGFHAQPEVNEVRNAFAPALTVPNALTHALSHAPQLFIRVSLFDPRHVARLVRILETGQDRCLYGLTCEAYAPSLPFTHTPTHTHS